MPPRGQPLARPALAAVQDVTAALGREVSGGRSRACMGRTDDLFGKSDDNNQLPSQTTQSGHREAPLPMRFLPAYLENARTQLEDPSHRCVSKRGREQLIALA